MIIKAIIFIHCNSNSTLANHCLWVLLLLEGREDIVQSNGPLAFIIIWSCTFESFSWFSNRTKMKLASSHDQPFSSNFWASPLFLFFKIGWMIIKAIIFIHFCDTLTQILVRSLRSIILNIMDRTSSGMSLIDMIEVAPSMK